MAKKLSVRNELRNKYPGISQKADYGRSPTTAIRLNCMECMGGNMRLPADCDTYDCFLWPYRSRKVDMDARPEGAVPSPEGYDALMAEWWRSRGMDPEEKAEQLRAGRDKANADTDDEDEDEDAVAD